MAFSVVLLESVEDHRRSVIWHRACHLLGMRLPLFLIHDLGALLHGLQGGSRIVMERREVLRRIRLDRSMTLALRQYRELMEELAQSSSVRRVSLWQLEEPVLGVVLAKALQQFYIHWLANRGQEFQEEVQERDFPDDLDLHAQVFARGYHQNDTSHLRQFLGFLVQNTELIRRGLDQIDPRTLRLLTTFSAHQDGWMENLAELWRLFTAPEASEIVQFSTELLPSLLESPRADAEQFFRLDGYAGVSRHGPVDSVLPSEMAIDEDLFIQKYLDNELLRFSYQRQQRRQERVVYLLVDSSASMRGRRTVFARGLALGLARRWTLKGARVLLRFFDSHLQRLFDLKDGAPNLAAFLGHRTDGPRLPVRCFQELHRHLQALQQEDQSLEVLFITHYECHLPVELLQEIRTMARLGGVFLFPSRVDLTPNYLEALDHYRVVRESELIGGAERLQSAQTLIREL